MTEHVKIRQESGVLEISWNRPEKKNALSQAMYGAAADALDRASGDASVRVVLLTSEGDSFTAGNDLADFASANAGGSDMPRESGRFIATIAGFEKPIVAGVPGLAVGVGGTMLLHCDLVYVAETAKITIPFAGLGLTPEAASSITLPARIGHVRAFAMFCLGEPLTGLEAARIGYANAALPAGEVLDAARGAALRLSRQPIGAVIATKKLMRDTQRLAGRIREEGVIFGQRLLTAEAREAFTAFAEKRPPDFTKL
ncbi:MAG: enoyl-CoA hydratase [Hyphomonadaceae bacterium]